MNPKRLLWMVTTLFLVSGIANAALVLTIDDPSTSGVDLRIVDQDLNDASDEPGLVSAAPTDIGGVMVGEANGLSKSVEGSPTAPILILSSQSRVEMQGGLVIISLTDTDFTANLPYKASATGGTGGTFQFDFFGDSNNTEFGKSFDIGSSNILTGNPIDPQSFQSAANPVGSLTIRANIGFTGSFQTGGFSAKIEALAVITCDGDFDKDNDVDGKDAAVQAAGGTGIGLEDFAANFGKPDCSQTT